ncbi:hypothetical protein ACFE04_005455 [Oxalis oulophora]
MVSDIAKIAAARARDYADTFFGLGKIDMAINSLTAARQLDAELPGLDGYYTAYMVHSRMEKEKTWYEILGINNPETELSIIKKEYKKLALILHPDKNSSKAAEEKNLRHGLEEACEERRHNGSDSHKKRAEEFFIQKNGYNPNRRRGNMYR